MNRIPETIQTVAFVDVHVHLREPGDNKSETIANGSRAAALGGYALVCDMPNNPGNPTWSEEKLDEKIAIAQSDAYIPVEFYAGSQPESDNIGELTAMSKKAVGLKLYGAPTTGNENDYEANEFEPIVREWHKVAPAKPIMLHAGEDNLEDMIDMVSGTYEHALHVCHVNDPKEVEAVLRARDLGQSVTCGVTPHHLFKTVHDELTQGWFARMKPPLASQVDAEKLWSMLVDGHIDVVESDYAPHSREAKWNAEAKNPEGIHDKDSTTCYGVPGIENIGPMMLRQMKLGAISMDRLSEVMSTKPQEIIGISLPKNTIVTWEMNDYKIRDEADVIASGAGWTPYAGYIGSSKLQSMQIGNEDITERLL